MVEYIWYITWYSHTEFQRAIAFDIFDLYIIYSKNMLDNFVWIQRQFEGLHMCFSDMFWLSKAVAALFKGNKAKPGRVRGAFFQT